MRKILFVLGMLAAGPLWAGVPQRIVYQGRVTKGGVPLTEKADFQVTLVSPTGSPRYEVFNGEAVLSKTGDFSIELKDLPPNIDWGAGEWTLEVRVGEEGSSLETLTPSAKFSATPYAFLAQKVDEGGVGTLAIADGAVTDAKVAAGIDASKIEVSTGTYLSAWSTAAGKIRASELDWSGSTTTTNHAERHKAGGADPLVDVSPSQIKGTALVGVSTMTQTVQPTSNVVPLAVKGAPGGSSTLSMFELWDNQVIPQKRLSVRGDGKMELTGDLEVSGSVRLSTGTAQVLKLENTTPVTGKTWEIRSQNDGTFQISNGGKTALSLNPDGSVSFPQQTDVRAVLSSSFTVGTSSLVQLLLEDLAVKGGRDALNEFSDNQFKAQTPGRYLVHASIHLTSPAAGTYSLYVRKGDSTVLSAVQSFNSPTNDVSLATSDVISLNANDSLRMYVETESGGTDNIGASEALTFLTIHRIP